MFEKLTDAQLTTLHSVLSEELDERYKHHPDEEPQEHWEACSELRNAATNEAKKRKMWWARG